jgi:hypothetical protein
MVNKRGWKIVFWASFVQITEIHTNANCALLLIDKNQVWYPFRQFHRVDETNFEQFIYVILYCRYFARIDRVKLMSDWFDVRISHDFMFNNLWVNSWHLLISHEKMSWNSLNNLV